MKSYVPDIYYGYMCTVTLTYDIRPLVNVMTCPCVIDNN